VIDVEDTAASSNTSGAVENTELQTQAVQQPGVQQQPPHYVNVQAGQAVGQFGAPLQAQAVVAYPVDNYGGGYYYGVQQQPPHYVNFRAGQNVGQFGAPLQAQAVSFQQPGVQQQPPHYVNVQAGQNVGQSAAPPLLAQAVGFQQPGVQPQPPHYVNVQAGQSVGQFGAPPPQEAQAVSVQQPGVQQQPPHNVHVQAGQNVGQFGAPPPQEAQAVSVQQPGVQQQPHSVHENLASICNHVYNNDREAFYERFCLTDFKSILAWQYDPPTSPLLITPFVPAYDAIRSHVEWIGYNVLDVLVGESAEGCVLVAPVHYPCYVAYVHAAKHFREAVFTSVLAMLGQENLAQPDVVIPSCATVRPLEPQWQLRDVAQECANDNKAWIRVQHISLDTDGYVETADYSIFQPVVGKPELYIDVIEVDLGSKIPEANMYFAGLRLCWFDNEPKATTDQQFDVDEQQSN